MTEFLSNLLVFPFIFTLCLGLAGGIMQGFTGWGGAMLMMPLITLVYPPAEALALLVVGGLIMSAQLYPRALKEVTWDSMRPMLLALIIFTPVGTILLLYMDPTLVRTIIGIILVIVSLVILSGWQYRGKQNIFSILSFGGISGVINGFAGLGSSILAIYIMALPNQASVQRSNIIIASGVIIFTIMVVFALNGVMDWDLVIRGILLAPTQMAGAVIGTRLFHHFPQEYFKKITLIIIAILGVSAIVF
ncbi:MAG: sulfite exporter TauE/SafE family protein [Pseudomonadota bacterium]|nr:sulfite exporter TauE/SafE family protein [Pseudomonadota bacterium]